MVVDWIYELIYKLNGHRKNKKLNICDGKLIQNKKFKISNGKLIKIKRSRGWMDGSLRIACSNLKIPSTTIQD